MNQKGFSQLILMVIIGAVLVLGGGSFWYYQQSAGPNIKSAPETQVIQKPASNEKSPEPEEFDAKAYAIYLLTEGTISEKRELLSNLKSRLTFKNKILTLESVPKKLMR